MKRHPAAKRSITSLAFATAAMLAACSGSDAEVPSTSFQQVAPTDTPDPAPVEPATASASPPTADAPATASDTTVATATGALDACPAFRSETLGTLPDELTELSGWALSKRHADVLWGHNDAGEGARLIGVSALDGSLVGDIVIENATDADWEDIATYTDSDGQHWIVIADTGDNAERREHVQLVLVREPELGERIVPADGVVTIEWASGAHDVEALIIDPLTGDVVMIGKRFSATPSVSIDRLNVAQLQPGTIVTPDHVGTFEVPAGQPFGPTAGSINAAGTTIGLLFYDNLALTWNRAAGASVVDTILNDEPCTIPAGTGKLESLAFTADGTLLIATEGRSVPLTALIAE